MKSPKHILVIRLSAMGDVGMTVPVLRVLTQTYPNVIFTVVSKQTFQPFFIDIPNCRFLIADIYGKHQGLGILKLAEEAKSLGIDAVADLHNVIRSKLIRNYLRFRGITTATIDKGRAEKNALVNANGKPIKQLKSTHQRYADVFAQLGLPIDLSSHQFPAKKELLPVHHDLIGAEPRKIIGIAPFAAYPSKVYPMEQMLELIHELNATNQFKIFLFGGGDEETTILKNIESKFDHVTNLSGKLTFADELILLSNLDLMIAMDSGNGHLAAMYDVPVLTLWGVTHPYAGFKPFGQPNANQLVSDRTKYPLIPTSIYGNTYPDSYKNAMKTIPVSLILEKAYALL